MVPLARTPVRVLRVRDEVAAFAARGAPPRTVLKRLNAVRADAQPARVARATVSQLVAIGRCAVADAVGRLAEAVRLAHDVGDGFMSEHTRID